MKQELFDIALEHIRQQGKPSMQCVGTCLYQGPDGVGCAARPFITNYKPEMESLPISSVIERYPHDVDPRAAREPRFVGKLQHAHDKASMFDDFMLDYEHNMQKLAEEYDLEYKGPVA